MMPDAVSGAREAPWPIPMSTIGSAMPGHVGDIYSEPAEPEHPDKGNEEATCKEAGVAKPPGQLRDGDGYHKVRNRHREKGNTSLNRCETVNNLEKLGNKKPEAQHGAKKKETCCVCSDTFPTRK